MNESLVVLPNIKVSLSNAKSFLDYYFHEGKLGGMLIPNETQMELGREVNLQILFLEENRRFNIRGVTRWRRLNHQPNLPRGTGVEFAHAERNTRDILLDFSSGRKIFTPQRKFPRLPALIEVEYATDTVFLTDITDNVGTGGAFILTDNPPPVGSALRIKLKPPANPRGIYVDAEVIWQRQDDRTGVGIRFVFPWYRSKRKLNKLIDEIRAQMGLSLRER